MNTKPKTESELADLPNGSPVSPATSASSPDPSAVNAPNAPIASKGSIEQPSSISALKQTVPIARWIIFFQAGLLGITATTFFIFGLMVGNFTAPSSRPASAASSTDSQSTPAAFAGDCKIAGQVMIKKRTKNQPDTGAVIIVLPEDGRPTEREDPSLVMPERFVPLDNPAIEAIHEAGGAVVRADRRGEFEVLVDQNRSYILLVISMNKPSHPDRQLTKKQTAMIGTFFSPAEKLVQGKEIFWDEFVTDKDRIDQPIIEF